MSKMSKTGEVLAVLEAAGHTDPAKALVPYHAAKAAVNACRKRDPDAAWCAIRKALNPYNVRCEKPDFRVVVSTFNRSHMTCLTIA